MLFTDDHLSDLGHCPLTPNCPILFTLICPSKGERLHSAIILGSLCMRAKLLQLCPTICDPVDYSPPGSSVHGIFQARILEWVAISFSRRSSRPRDQTQISCVPFMGRWIPSHYTTWETLSPHIRNYRQFTENICYIPKELAFFSLPSFLSTCLVSSSSFFFFFLSFFPHRLLLFKKE